MIEYKLYHLTYLELKIIIVLFIKFITIQGIIYEIHIKTKPPIPERYYQKHYNYDIFNKENVDKY